jgi:hypothetical protein
MVGKTKPPTAEEKKRLTTLKEHCPCLPCLLVNPRHIRLPTIQHKTSGFKRDGHAATYSACEWHHLGIPPDGMNKQEASGFLGPSLAHSKRTFVQEYGTENTLIQVQDFILRAFDEFQWLDYGVPVLVRRNAVDYWFDLRN